MSRRKRRTVGPGLTGADLEAAVAAIAAEHPDLVAFRVDDALYPAVRPMKQRLRYGQYGDLDAGQALRLLREARAKLGPNASVQRIAVEVGRDRSTVYRWISRFGDA